MKQFTAEQFTAVLFVVMSTADDLHDPNKDAIMTGLNAITQNQALVQAGTDAVNYAMGDKP